MKEENSNIRFLSAISYIGVLFVVGHFSAERENPDVRFHKYQGFVMFVMFSTLYCIDGLLFGMLGFSPEIQEIVTLPVTLAVSAAYVFLTVKGVMSALQFKQTVLPFSIGFAAVRLRETIDRIIRS